MRGVGAHATRASHGNRGPACSAGSRRARHSHERAGARVMVGVGHGWRLDKAWGLVAVEWEEEEQGSS